MISRYTYGFLEWKYWLTSMIISINTPISVREYEIELFHENLQIKIGEKNSENGKRENLQ